MTRSGITRRDILKQVGTISAVGVVGSNTSMAMGTMQAISTEIRLPVALSPGAPKTDEIVATFTLPPKNRRLPIVQLLVHDITYGRYYYDFPYNPGQYSYVRHTTEAGYPTLNIDRLGSGESSHPAPEQLTLETHAFVLHQLIQTLRAGTFGAVTESDVMLVGHGYGALAAVKHQAQFGDADALILTGYTQQYAHAQNLSDRLMPTETLPAHQDETPRFDGRSPGYHTIAPGTRDTNYYSANTDPTTIAVDDRHKQTVADAELSTATDVFNASLDVNVPVLEVVGDQDAIFCGMNPCTAPLGATTTEPILWPNADFTMEVLPAMGHAMFLHRNASTAFSIMETWVNNQLDTG